MISHYTMRQVLLNLFVILLSFSFLYAGDDDRCKKLYEALYEYTNNDTISESDFKKCRSMVAQLVDCDYYEHVIEKDGKPFIDHFLTSTYGNICRKTNPDLGIPAYMEYLIEHENSAEELLSFSFERLFESYPEQVMNEIQEQDKSLQPFLLDKLAWGFLNNRHFEEKEIQKRNEILQRPVLNSKNYREVFNITYPALINKYEKYKISIDYLFEGINSYLQWSEEQKRKYDDR